jgi:2-polyprenyl-3-methyl-5-hydroxy-6-metoxy-1,4-benzoquinol methylase
MLASRSDTRETRGAAGDKWEMADVPVVKVGPGSAAASDPAIACRICGGDLRLWFVKTGRHVARCSGCGLIVIPEGVARDLTGVSIYESDRSVFEADGNEGYYLDDETNLANSRLKLEWVARDLPAGARLLDAGCNFGHFLKVAGERYEAAGFDISPAAVRWGREHFGVHAVAASIDDFAPPPSPYDAITSWDVIEHLEDPVAALQRFCGMLRPGGYLFLSTPDAGSFVARLLGRRWHYLDPVQHITVFSSHNLRNTLARCGFEVVRTRSLGHRYRVRYVLDRLVYLHRGGWLGMVASLARRSLSPFAEGSVYLNPGDVIILTARRAEAA